MNKTIWKFTLDLVDEQQVSLPKDAEILSVQVQNGNICLWALVDPEAEKETRYFEIFRTGHLIYCDMRIERKFIGTVQISYESKLVFHVFVRLN